jgi:hypothetical protein
MIQRRHDPMGHERRGVILLVVLAMLTLFAVVGLTFVLVAENAANSARAARDAETMARADMDPQMALNFILAQLIYDVSDNDPNGIYSSLRGYSLARSLYGWNDQLSYPLDRPFCGTGRLHNTTDPNLPAGITDELQMINHTVYTSDGIRHDPERPGVYKISGGTRPAWIGGFNVPYTFPDHNNLFLAAINPATGQVIVPSFHRDYIFGKLDNSDGNTGKWTSQAAKYSSIRPTPAYHTITVNGNTIAFPMPFDALGDVKNLDNAPGGMDSVWIDIGAPVMIAPDGTKYKMLVAPLILQLDDRVNLNTAGNWLGAANTQHRSHMGFGQWEINPSTVLNANAAEWLSIFKGSATTGSAGAQVRARYDLSQNGTASPPGIQGSPATPAGTTTLRAWAQIDYNASRDDGANAGNQAEPYQLPLAGGTTNPTPLPGNVGYYGFPVFPTTTYRNGGMTPSAANGGGNTEYIGHPVIYSPVQPTAPNRRLRHDLLPAMLRYNGTGSATLNTDLLRLLPVNLVTDSKAAVRRNLVTTLSTDFDRPGIVPYVWNPLANGPEDGTANAKSTTLALQTPMTTGTPPTPTGAPYTLAGNNPIPFPTLGGTPPNSASGKSPSEFDPATWRSVLSAVGRLNLNAPLPDYPDPTNITDATAFQTATQTATTARQNLAASIFSTLRQAAGGGDPTDVASPTTFGVTSPQFQALRYLAQLSVNIVDYIDADGISTPFQWYNDGAGHYEYVFGFELPRLVLNEVYAQSENSKTVLDAIKGLAAGAQQPFAAGDKYVHTFWLELMNPMPAEQNLLVSGSTTKYNWDTQVYFQKPASYPVASAVGEANYRVLIIDASPYNVPAGSTNVAPTGGANPIFNPANTTGDPNPPTTTSPDTTLKQVKVLAALGATVDNNGVAQPITINATSPGDWVTSPPPANPPTPPQAFQMNPMDPTTNFLNDGVTAANQAGRSNGNPCTGFFGAGSSGSTTVAGVVTPNTQDDPNLPAMQIGTNKLQYQWPLGANGTQAADAATPAGSLEPMPMILLQRLANPAMPWQNDSTVANYNPYLTVDTVTLRTIGWQETSDYRQATAFGTFNGNPVLSEINDARKYVTQNAGVAQNGNYVTNNNYVPVSSGSRISFGRNQPFTSTPTNRVGQQLAGTAGANGGTNGNTGLAKDAANNPLPGPYNTFFQQNNTAGGATGPMNNFGGPGGGGAFTWLTHLDRPVVSPAELIYTSGLPPLGVLQNFIYYTGQNTVISQGHIAPWTDPTARIHRFLEMVSTSSSASWPNLQSGQMTNWGRTNGRMQGKINLNMLWQTDNTSGQSLVFNALADQQGGNFFNATDVSNAFTNFMNARSTSSTPPVPFGPTDKFWTSTVYQQPLWGLGQGYANNNGQSDAMGSTQRGAINSILQQQTALKTSGQQGAVFDATGGLTPPLHPYQSKDLVNKIFNNATTRSNVFAVWLTIGFFNVTDVDPNTGATLNPPKLGAEIGREQNRHVRHRMFALVDRSQLMTFPTTTPKDGSGNPMLASAPQAGTAVTVSTGPFTDARTGRSWTLQAGNFLTLEPNTQNEETVILASNGTSLTFTPTLNHATTNVNIRGNPGPWNKYDVRFDPQVVPYFALID